MADVAKNIISTDAGERNGSIMVGAPKAAGTAIYGTNYRIRAGGEAATTTITFAGAADVDDTAQCATFVHQAEELFGLVDILVGNAGIGQPHKIVIRPMRNENG